MNIKYRSKCKTDTKYLQYTKDQYKKQDNQEGKKYYITSLIFLFANDRYIAIVIV